MTVRIYVRASTKDQDAERALSDLVLFANTIDSTQVQYIENHSGTKLERPQLNKLLSESEQGDTLLVESVDRLSRLTQKDFEVLKQRIKDKGLKLVVADLPTTHQTIGTSDDITGSILSLINNMLIDLLATMARLDNDKRKERIKQGLERSGYVPTGRKANTSKHERIKELLKLQSMTKEEVAKAASVGIATVYRVAKELKDQ
ncbi:recombinase family protein [Acinetobacter baumannii]|uniref:Recombinase family protein n=2 Tax=Acinetobacter calcoaceticus/baumannii complex TaxID=909768 RepID=A0AAP1R081_ACIBA|nr:recombinase family protein [Acinetobacter baumannii]MBD2850181.1 recombinase family protein [Acinetobacter baumannii]MBD2852104.1 recombinase family protein [Acinetobacter baumannii]MBD3134650.1 recombinase family protein [Acinetobacter baumannii]MBE0307453.1 recombinase family protein [Acinetobacter baumannii]MBE0309148.1 recombinase family protein [Acinetobacter baumannii]